MRHLKHGARCVLSALVLAGLSACSEPTTIEGPGINTAKNARTTSTDAALPSEPVTVGPAFVGFVPSAPPLATYDASFKVTVGHADVFAIPYRDTTLAQKFLRLEIPKDAEFFDANGNRIARNSTVMIGVRVDPVTAGVTFSPHGAQFSTRYPAVLKIDYTYLDLGGRTPSALWVWYQSDTGWVSSATTVEVNNRWLVATLGHFSNYAIAY